METFIPFSGFYNSNHDAILDDAIEQTFSYDQVPDNFYDHVDWQKVHDAYARNYTGHFETWLSSIDQSVNITSLQYESLYSPREYNFETDRIKCTISLADVQTLMAATNQGDLANVIKERFTSRSGFISFYSNDVLTWLEKPLETWDANEIETLILAFISSMGEQLDDYEIMEHSRCNDGIDQSLEAGYNAETWKLINAEKESLTCTSQLKT